MERTCCEREGASSCAALKEKALSPPLHRGTPPTTRQCDSGSRDGVRTVVQGSTRLDLSPPLAPPGRHIEKRPRSRSPQPTSMSQHEDRADETSFSTMPVTSPKIFHPRLPPPSQCEPIVMDAESIKDCAGATPSEETKPHTSWFNKKTRVEPRSGFLDCTGYFSRAVRESRKAKSASHGRGGESHDSSMCGSMSSMDLGQQQPGLPKPVPAGRPCCKEDDTRLGAKGEQLECGHQTVNGVREDRQRLREELRPLQAQVHRSEEAQVPTNVEYVATPAEDAASWSTTSLAAQREKLMDLLHASKAIKNVRNKEAGRSRHRPRKGCAINGKISVNHSGAKGRKTQEGAQACASANGGKGCCSPPTSTSSACEPSAPDQSASLSSVSLCHYARSLNRPKRQPSCGTQHEATRPTTAAHGPQFKDSEVPSAAEITPPPDLSSPSVSSSSSHGGEEGCPDEGYEFADDRRKPGLSDSSTACSAQINGTPVREQKIDDVLGGCGLVAASHARRTQILLPKRKKGSLGHNSSLTMDSISAKQESCVQQEEAAGCDLTTEVNPKPHKLPPPSCFFIDMSDKVRNSSEDSSWCRVQEELKKTFIRKANDIPSALQAHNDNPELLGNRLVSFVSHKLQSVQNELYEKKLSSLNRLVGELKGCVEGFRIRIDVEGEGWRGRVVGLEKELECLKDETEEELVDIKSRLFRDLRAKMDELMAEKMDSDQCCRETLMEEIRSVKAEMGCLVRDTSKKVLMSEVQKLLTGRHCRWALSLSFASYHHEGHREPVEPQPPTN